VTRFVSEVLAKHDRAAFASGNDKIDGYFRNVVSQDVRRDYAACYVLVERDTQKLAGFYTLASSSIPLDEVPPIMARKLPRYPSVPAVLIGWLARDMGFRGQSIGAMLLHDAFARIEKSPIAAHAIVADAIDDEAVAFYKKLLFIAFAARPRSLFLPVATVVDAIRS